MRFFDCNSSYGRAAVPPHRFAATPKDLLEDMDFCGIDKALVYHTSQRFASPATWNAVVAEQLCYQPRLVPVWAVLPETCSELPPPEKLIEEMKASGVGALWAFPQEHHYRLNGDTFLELFRLMAEKGIPLFAKENLFQLKELLGDCPDLTVVAVNQGPHSLERHLRPLMDAFDKLHVDTSYMLVEGLIEELCDRYGAERILFGTATPDNCSGAALLRLAQADIDEHAKTLIAAGNLERLLDWAKAAERVEDSNSTVYPQPCRTAVIISTCPSKIVAEYMVEGRSLECPIVDLHGHWGVIGDAYLPCAEEQAMLQSLRRAGVNRIVCSAHDSLFADTEDGNRAMQEAVDRNADILSGYWTVNPNYPELAVRAPKDFQHSRGFVGFKFLPDYHVYPVTGDRYRAALEYGEEHSLLNLVHTWGGSPFNSPQMLGEVAARHPHATFLMGHSGYGDWTAAVSVARELPNVYLELTAVYVAHDFAMQPNGSGTPTALASCLQVGGILEYMVDEVGSEKIIYGTDMPWYSPHFAAGAVLFARIDDDSRHNILHRNAERLLGMT